MAGYEDAGDKWCLIHKHDSYIVGCARSVNASECDDCVSFVGERKMLDVILTVT